MAVTLLDRELIPITWKTPALQTKISQSATTCLWLLGSVQHGHCAKILVWASAWKKRAFTLVRSENGTQAFRAPSVNIVLDFTWTEGQATDKTL